MVLCSVFWVTLCANVLQFGSPSAQSRRCPAVGVTPGHQCEGESAVEGRREAKCRAGNFHKAHTAGCSVTTKVWKVRSDGAMEQLLERRWRSARSACPSPVPQWVPPPGPCDFTQHHPPDSPGEAEVARVGGGAAVPRALH